MKIRGGFVSNSSSSSFCIYGSEIDISKFQGAAEDSDGDWYETVDELVAAVGLEFICDEGSGYCAVGKSYSEIGDDETGKQFKDGIEQAVKKAFPDQDLKFDTCEGEISC